MKNLFTAIVCCALMNINHCFTQVTCPDFNNGVIMGGKIPVDFVPTEFSPDIFPSVPDESDRLIIWVHGLGGNGDTESDDSGNSWIMSSAQTEVDYKTTAERPDYSDVSLIDAAVNLHDVLIPFIPYANERTFSISHSQGVIVSRELNKMYHDTYGTDNEIFHGLVSFGGPNQGARILNNIPDLTTWANNTANILKLGPEAEDINDIAWGLIDVTDVIPIVNEYMSNLFSDYLFPKLFDSYTSGITNDYAVGAPELEELNDFIPDIPVVCFYGIEDDPLIWNTLVYSLPGHLPNDHPAFEAGNDHGLIDLSNNAFIFYNSKALAWTWMADYISMEAGEFPPIYSTTSEDEAVLIRDGYLNGELWWLQANQTWRNIIGANEIAPGGYHCDCINEEDFDITMDTYDVAEGETCDASWGDCELYQSWDIIQKQSDGIVLAESAGNCPGMTFSKDMIGSNHFSMRNDENTGAKLQQLFFGNYGLFFKTDER